MNKMKLLLTLAIPVLLSQELQAQSSRLTAQANWTHNGAEFMRNDSSSYTYLSTARGGDLNHTLKFDESVNWSFVMGDTLNNNTRQLQEFDANNNITTRVTQTWDAVSGSWANQFKYIYTYGTGNRKESMVTQHWDGTSAWVTDSKNVYTYNVANQLTIDKYTVWDGVSSYVDVSEATYYYDASGNLINETDLSLMPSTVYTTKKDYTYNAANKMLTSTSAAWDGATWVNTEMTTNTYDTSNMLTSMLHQNWDGVAFANDMLHLYSNFNASGSPMTEIVQTWNTSGSGSWDDLYNYSYTYNGNNQMATSVRQSMDISIGWTYTFGDTKANYYYGSFVSVKNVSNNGGTANFFPVPAQNQLNIELNWNQAQTSTVILSDMQGRTLSTMSLPSATKFNATLPVGHLANGIYTVRINGAEGQIVKQIVVSH